MSYDIREVNIIDADKDVRVVLNIDYLKLIKKHKSHSIHMFIVILY